MCYGHRVLDGPSEAVVTQTSREEVATGAGRSPTIHPSEPGKLAWSLLNQAPQ